MLFIYNVCFIYIIFIILFILYYITKILTLNDFFSGNINYSFFSQIDVLFFPKNILTTSQKKEEVNAAHFAQKTSATSV